jgi:protein TonB
MNANIFKSSNWNDVTNQGRNALVFENKNQEYGAYFIRKEYHNHVIAAIFWSLGAFGLLALVPYYISKFNTKPAEVIIPTYDGGVIMDLSKPDIKIEVPIAIEKQKKMVVATQNNQPLLATDNPLVEVDIIPNALVVNPGLETKVGDLDAKDFDAVDEDAKDLLTGSQDNDKLFISVEIMPQFPGGEAGLLNFMANNTNYPAAAKENGLRGTVYISFVVDKTGKVVNAQVARGIRGGQLLEMEALRVINSMPRWSIGMQNGNAAAVQFCLPFKFSLQ